MGNLMSLYQTQTQMGAQQDMLAHAPTTTTKLGCRRGPRAHDILAGNGPDLVADGADRPAAEHRGRTSGLPKRGGSEEECDEELSR